MWQGVAMRAIPLPVRERIIHLYEQGKSTTEIAAFSGFCVAAVRRVRQHFKARGTLEPQTHLCGRKTLLTARRKARLQKLVADQRMPRWRSWGRGWIVRLALRPWIYGCGGWG